MKFYNREEERKLLKRIKHKNVRVAIIGRRRVGKTRLVEEVIKDSVNLFFPAEETEVSVIKKWSLEYEFIPNVRSFYELFNYLFSNFPDKIYFFDEFQNVLKINKSFLFDLQRMIDKYKPKLVVTGSLISLMNKIIKDYKSPLFGRFDVVLMLDELRYETVLDIGRDLGFNMEDTVKLYSVFGGIPKYYELLEIMDVKSIEEFLKEMFVLYPRPLYNETKIMLKEEFGKEYNIIFSILEAISIGKNKMSEISNFVGREQTKITKYLWMLQNDFEIIRREIPITYDKSKKGLYVIKNNLFWFWFSNVFRYNNLLEQNREDELIKGFDHRFNVYVGRMFERFVIEVLKNRFKDYRLGRWWWKDKEIDIVGINEERKELMAIEVKWKDLGLRDVREIIMDLEENVKYVDWFNSERREKLGVFAKKIDKRAKEWLRNEGYLGWDLRDLQFV